MCENSVTGFATKNGRRPKATGTVAILLTLLENVAAPAFMRAYAGKVLADVGAVGALPALRRVAKDSSATEVQVAAREAADRITQERRAQQHGEHTEEFWYRLEAALRHCLMVPFC